MLEEARADWVHVDVMDGHFVPNFTFGPPVVKSLKNCSSLPLDCHLMISEPEKWILPFAEGGAHNISIHVEATSDLGSCLAKIRDHHCSAGVALNPDTPLSQIESVLDQIDLVLIMTVQAGFGGQKLVPQTIAKVKEMVKLRGNRPILIQVDGGIHLDNISELVEAGADVFVVGSAIFQTSDPRDVIQKIQLKIS